MSNKMNNVPTIRFKSSRKLSINRKALRDLGKPDNVIFFVEKSKHILLVGVSPEVTNLSFKVNENCYNSNNGCFRIECSAFINAIIKLTGWNSGKNYAVTGEYIEQMNMIAFYLDKAVEESAP